jgi:putative ABC transport system ATP-binding protein
VPIVELRDVVREYRGAGGRRALDGVSLGIERGEHVSLMGVSGSGKSTLLNIMGLLDAPTSGSYALDGIDVTDLSEGQRAWMRGARIGYIFQSFHLYDARSIQDNVEQGLAYLGLHRRTRRQMAGEALERVGLSRLAGQKARLLSGGERQRVAIARAVASRPDLLLADEPTGNLDSVNTANLLGLLDELHASGSTLVVVTHDPAVGGRARRQLWIEDGHLTERTPADQGAR